jgi:hypothetical protein
MTELEGGDKPVSKRVMNIEPDTVLGGRFRRSNRVIK